MASHLSAYPAHVALHVIRRGRGRAACFFDEADRAAYRRWLGRYAARYECGIHAYVLMGNHVHLLVTASTSGGIEALMRSLAARHSRFMNEVHGHKGPVWDEGFEASAVHVRRHLLACMRYIELNPVRAGLVRIPHAYPWSSFAANALGREDALVTPHPVYCALGRTAGTRQATYLRLFGGGPISAARTQGARRTGPRAPSRPT